MKKKIIILFSCFFVFSICPFQASTISADESFQALAKNELNDFGKTQSDAFQNYKKTVNDDFKTYKTIMNEEFNRYKKEVSKYWEDGHLSGKTTWVDYSKDYKSRKVVDYENGTIEIELIVGKDTPIKEVEKRVAEKLTDLATETTKTAFNNDVLSNRIEDRMVAAIEDVKVTDSIAEVPVASELITGSVAPDAALVAASVKKLQQSAELKEKAAQSDTEKIISLKIKIPNARMNKKAVKYAANVEKYSKERKLDPALIFAIMQTESSFNPMAKSYVPAYGLMQIVPRSAGKDASKLVYGKPVLLAPSYLYDCENNIKMGSAYLSVLTYRYLRAVKDEKSRKYCAIAAYNTGTGNVAKAFIGKYGMREASVVINKMTPEEVYNTLLTKLPYEETRKYMKKVTSRMQHYGKN